MPRDRDALQSATVADETHYDGITTFLNLVASIAALTLVGSLLGILVDHRAAGQQRPGNRREPDPAHHG